MGQCKFMLSNLNYRMKSLRISCDLSIELKMQCLSIKKYSPLFKIGILKHLKQTAPASPKGTILFLTEHTPCRNKAKTIIRVVSLESVSIPGVDKWAAQDKTYSKICVTSKVSDQPVDTPSMKRVLIHSSLDSPEAVEGTCDQRRFWSDCVDVKAESLLVAQVLL